MLVVREMRVVDMEPDVAAQLTLAAYAAAALLVIIREALRCRDGWAAWMLFVINRLYLPLAFHWRANRRCPFPARGPALIIANHRSAVDPLFIWMNHHFSSKDHVIRVIGFLTAREYCEMGGLVGFICRAMRSIPTDRDGRDTGPARAALRRLKNGDWVGVFPEGGINTGERLLEGTPGTAWLALRSKVPVYPVFVHGAPLGKTMIEPFYKFCRVRVSYGDPIDLSRYYGSRKTSELLREVTDLLMARLAELGGMPTTEHA